MAKKQAEKKIVQCGVYNIESHWVLMGPPPTNLLVEAEIWVKYDNDTREDFFMNFSYLAEYCAFAITKKSIFADEAGAFGVRSEDEPIAVYESPRVAYASPYGRAARVLKTVYKAIMDNYFEE